jgi:ATP-dependent DNA helicase RecG
VAASLECGFSTSSSNRSVSGSCLLLLLRSRGAKMTTYSQELLLALQAIHAGTPANDVESGTLDFKQVNPNDIRDTIKVIVEAVVCFANTDGGIVAVGILDKPGGAQAFQGCNLDPGMVQQRIFELTEPPLSVDVRAEHHYGVPLLVVSVPHSLELHSDKKGRAQQRVGQKCLPLNPQDQALLRERRAGYDWSAVPTERRIEDVSPLALQLAREDLRVHPDRYGELSELQSNVDLLTALGVLSDDGFLLRAGELLFCTLPQLDVAGINYIYRHTPGGEPAAVRRLSPPLLVAFHQTIDLIAARRTFVPILLPRGQQLNIADFPEVAVREALANAVIHRDYYFQRPVTVEHSPDAFVVTSPGPLVGGVTPANILTHDSVTRNRRLAFAVRTLGLAEEIGRGVDRMYREMIQTGRVAPTIESGPDQVRVVLTGGEPNTPVARFIAQLPAVEQRDTDTMLTLRTLRDRPHVDAAALAPVLQKTVVETEAVLRRLSSNSVRMIEAIDGTLTSSSVSYQLRDEVLRQLAPALSYKRSYRLLTPDERQGLRDRALALVAELGEADRDAIRVGLDISGGMANSLLDSMTTRGIIVRRSHKGDSRADSFALNPQSPSVSDARSTFIDHVIQRGVLTTDDADRTLPLAGISAGSALASFVVSGLALRTDEEPPRYVAGPKFPELDYFARRLAEQMTPGEELSYEKLRSVLAVDDRLVVTIADSLCQRRILQVLRPEEYPETGSFIIGQRFPGLAPLVERLAREMLHAGPVDVEWITNKLDTEAQTSEVVVKRALSRGVIMRERKDGRFEGRYVPGVKLFDALDSVSRRDLEDKILAHVEVNGSIDQDRAQILLNVATPVAVRALTHLVRAKKLAKVTTRMDGETRVSYQAAVSSG